MANLDEAYRTWARRVELAEEVGHFVNCKSLAFNQKPGDNVQDCTCALDRAVARN